MKRLLALIALCLPIYLFAQGFGSFSHDQPYLAKDISSASSAPDPQIYGAKYWWRFHDMPTNSFVTNWSDTISGSIWTNGSVGATRPTNSSLGVYFTRASSQNLTNFGNPEIATNSTHFLIINRTATTSFQYMLSYDTGGGFNIAWYTLGSLFLEFDAIPYVNGQIANNSWTDIALVIKKPDQTMTYYTNGVPALTNTLISLTTPRWWKLMGGHSSGGYYGGYIREVADWTNSLSASNVMVMHQYATNKYGYSP